MKRSLILAGLAAGNMGAWFVFQWLLLQKLGAGSGTDALFAAMTLPQFFQMLVVPGITNTLIPYFAGEHRGYANWQMWRIFAAVSVASLVLVSILLFSASLWTSIVFPGFAVEQIAMTNHLLPLTSVAMICVLASAVVTAYLNAFHRFVSVEWVGLIVSSLAVVGCLALSDGLTAYLAAWFVFGRSALQLIALVWLAGFRSERNPVQTDWRQLLKKLGTTLVGTTVTKTDPLFDRYFTSQLTPGVLSLYYMAQQAVNAGTFIFHKALVAPRQPRFVELYKQAKTQAQDELLRNSVVTVVVIAAIGLALFGLVGEKLLGIAATTKGAMSPADIRNLWVFIMVMAGGLVGGSIGSLLNAQFFAAGDMATPTRVMIATFVGSIALKFWLFGSLGAIGIALATSLFYCGYCAVMCAMLFFKRRSLRVALG